MIPLVEDNTKDVLHSLDRDLLLLCALHLEDMMADAIGTNEGSVAIGELLIDKSPVYAVRWTAYFTWRRRIHSRGDLHNCLQSEASYEAVVLWLWVTAPIHAGNNNTKVDGLAG